MFRLVSFESRWRRERARGRVGPSCRREPRSYLNCIVLLMYLAMYAVKMLAWKVKVVARKPMKRTPDFLAFPRNKAKPSL